MHFSLARYLSATFPELQGLRYQSVLETMSFLLVTSMLIGATAAALALIVYEL